MTVPITLLQQHLRQHHQSLTKSRILLFKLLWEQKPQTINQIVTKVDGRIDRVSVYRTLKVFEQIGIVQRVSVGWKSQVELAGPFSHHHHHLTCLHCHKVEAITNHQVEKLIHQIADQQHFRIQQHQLEIQGLCQDCQKIPSVSADLPTLD